MKIINLKQGSEEWLEWRREGLGGSDIPVIMGTNKYKTKKVLWEEKCGYREPPEQNAAMAHGSKCEPIARDWVNKRYGLHFEPICVQDPVKGHFRASLDGYDYEKNMTLEIKAPISRRILDAAAEGNLEESYYDQGQWGSGLVNATSGLIAVYDERIKGCYMFENKPDVPRVRQMRAAADDFWLDVKLGKCPENSKGEYDVVENDDTHGLLEQIIHMDMIVKDQKIYLDEMKQRFYGQNDGKPFKAYGATVMLTEPRVTYDYKQMKEDGLDLSKYEKKGKPSYRLILPS